MQAERRTMVGTVISDKMDKTVVVAIETLKRTGCMARPSVRSELQGANEDNNSHSGDVSVSPSAGPSAKTSGGVGGDTGACAMIQTFTRLRVADTQAPGSCVSNAGGTRGYAMWGDIIVCGVKSIDA